jgi:hypothetical protein
MTKTWWEAPMGGSVLSLQSGFREEDFLEINQSETRIACGGHVC